MVKPCVEPGEGHLSGLRETHVNRGNQPSTTQVNRSINRGRLKVRLEGLGAWRHEVIEMVLSWFSNKLSPIAVDIGTEAIKLLQVEPREGQYRLAATACDVIPEEVRGKTAERRPLLRSAAQDANEGIPRQAGGHVFARRMSWPSSICGWRR